MSVPSWHFLIFVVAGAVAFNAMAMKWWRESIWLLLNLAFVWSFSRTAGSLLPFAGFLALGYLAIHAARHMSHWVVPVAAGLVLLLFIWLKRYSFIPPVLLLPSWVMTIGLSYVFFRVMHLIIDAGQGMQERIGLIRYLNFTLNFPAFVSGPIQRYQDYEANESLPLTLADIGAAAWRMIVGAFKVLIVSSALLTWQRDTIANLNTDLPLPQMALSGALVVVLYPLFLYANFSGYTDFVIGTARLFRLSLPENFDRPFLAGNFIEFWSRWHISLSQWLRSYVFNPLLMGWIRRHRSARSKQYPTMAALFVTFFLVGAWHGPTTEFLFFGLLQGGGVAGNRLYQVAMGRWRTAAGYERLCANPLYRCLSRGLTFTWFAFTLLWFWASWQQISTLAANLGGAGLVAAVTGTVCAASTILAISELSGRPSRTFGAIMRSRYTRTASASAMILAMAVAGLVLNLSSPEIVYKQF
jgi:alginate O-acetyltransferase complex protein AlgI